MRKSEYPAEAKTLGQKIRRKRMDLGLSLLEVAQKVGISEGYLSRIEAGKQTPIPELAGKIAKELNENIKDYTTTAFLDAQANQLIKIYKKSPEFSIENLSGIPHFSHILKLKKK